MPTSKHKKRVGLSPLEEACAREYMANGGNQAEAYRTCAPNADRYKSSTIWNRSSELFTRPHVQDYLEELRERARVIADQKLEISVERVLKELARIAFCDIRKMYDDNGNLLPIQELPDDVAYAVQAIETVGKKSDGVVKYKLNPKQPAIEKLAQHLRMFTDSVKKADDDNALPEWMMVAFPGKKPE